MYQPCYLCRYASENYHYIFYLSLESNSLHAYLSSYLAIYLPIHLSLYVYVCIYLSLYMSLDILIISKKIQLRNADIHYYKIDV